MICITGASGFLGSHIVRQLLQRNERVRVLLLAGDLAPNLEGCDVERFRGDVLDSKSLDRFLQDSDKLIHAAACTQLQGITRKKMYDINVEGTRQVCLAAIRAGVKKMVYISTVGILGASNTPQEVSEENGFPLSKKMRYQTYISSKWEASQVVAQLGRSLNAVEVLPAMLLGPGDSWMPSFTGNVAMILKHSVVISPKNLGVNIVDAADAARGITLALDKGISGRRYILAGENITMTQLNKMIREVSRRQMKIISVPEWMILFVQSILRLMSVLGIHYGDAVLENLYFTNAYWWYNASRARKELGWCREFSTWQSVERTVAWIKQSGKMG